MIFQAEIVDGAIVLQNIFLELLDSGLILEMKVSLDETFIEFNHLTQSQVLFR